MSPNEPRIVFVTLSNDVGSERIVSEMVGRGAACAVLGRPGSFASLCRGVHSYALPGRGGAWVAAMAVPRRLERLVDDWRPHAIVPIDDLAAQLLRDLATAKPTSPALRSLLTASLGDPAHYRTVCSRSRLLAVAATLGIRTPGQRSVASLQAAAAAATEFGYPVLLKREQTCGGHGVTLVERSETLSTAFRSADRRAKAKRLARRLIGLPTSDDPPLTLQAYVPGQLALRTVACRSGRVLAGITFAADRLDPPVTGASTVIRRIDHPGIEDAVSLLVAELGSTGFVSFDFLVSPDGSASLIELNARTVGSAHLGVHFGHDIYGLWLAQFSGSSARVPNTSPLNQGRPIALFPKEMMRDPTSACLSPDAPHYHDVPWHEPRVIAAYRNRLLRAHPVQMDLIDRRFAQAAEAERSAARDTLSPTDVESVLRTGAQPAYARKSVPTRASAGQSGAAHP